MSTAKPILITGTFRSGTTLIGDLLSQSSEMLVDNNRLEFWRDGWFNYADMSEDVKRRKIERLTDILADKGIHMGQDVPVDLDPVTLYRHVLHKIRSQTGTRVFVEKTTMATHAVGSFLHGFPEGRLIVMVRDPRDAMASWKHYPDVPGSGIKSYMAMPFYWMQIIDDILRLNRQKPSLASRMRVVRYEDLCTHPEEVLETILEFVGAGIDAAHLVYQYERSSRLRTGSSFTEHRSISPVSVGRWRSALSKREAVTIETICSRYMPGLDYAPAASRRLRVATVCPFLLCLGGSMIRWPLRGPSRIRDGRPTGQLRKRVRLMKYLCLAVGSQMKGSERSAALRQLREPFDSVHLSRGGGESHE